MIKYFMYKKTVSAYSDYIRNGFKFEYLCEIDFITEKTLGYLSEVRWLFLKKKKQR